MPRLLMMYPIGPALIPQSRANVYFATRTQCPGVRLRFERLEACGRVGRHDAIANGRVEESANGFRAMIGRAGRSLLRPSGAPSGDVIFIDAVDPPCPGRTGVGAERLQREAIVSKRRRLDFAGARGEPLPRVLLDGDFPSALVFSGQRAERRLDAIELLVRGHIDHGADREGFELQVPLKLIYE
jgi:hypothetical protein